MQIHDVQQGSEVWHALRRQYFTASEAPAMMGVSRFQTRAELLRQKATGLAPEPDAHQQSRFDAGHAAEAAYRPLAEEIIGEELYPVTGTEHVAGLQLLASFDGLTMDESTGFEHKLYSQAAADYIAEHGEPGPSYIWQLEHQLLVSGAEKILFATTDGTDSKAVWCWYASLPERRAALIAGWRQFAQDLAEWKPEPAAAAAPVGRTPESLPALRIEVTGAVTDSNLEEYRSHALAVIGSINRDLQTDQDFADARKAIKWCGDVETRAAAAKEHALGQTASIDALFRALDDIAAEARRTRLELEKLDKVRSEARRAEIYQSGVKRFQDHMAALNTRLGKSYMPVVPGVDFAGQIKGKRSFDAMQDAVDTHLANAKIAANDIADRIEINLRWLREKATGHAFLFADAAQLVLKDNEAFAAIAQQRIDAYEAAEAAAAAEAKRLADEAAAKAREEERQRIAQEQAQQQPAPAAEPVQQAAQLTPAPAPAANVVAMPARAPTPAAAPSTPPTLKLGMIAERLGFTLTAEFMRTLGFEPAGKDRAAVLYHEADFGHILSALVAHIQAVQAKAAA